LNQAAAALAQVQKQLAQVEQLKLKLRQLMGNPIIQHSGDDNEPMVQKLQEKEQEIEQLFQRVLALNRQVASQAQTIEGQAEQIAALQQQNASLQQQLDAPQPVVQQAEDMVRGESSPAGSPGNGNDGPADTGEFPDGRDGEPSGGSEGPIAR
jgi:hypothetical protein